MERRLLRAELDEALRGLDRGFSANAEQRKVVCAEEEKETV